MKIDLDAIERNAQRLIVQGLGMCMTPTSAHDVLALVRAVRAALPIVHSTCPPLSLYQADELRDALAPFRSEERPT